MDGTIQNTFFNNQPVRSTGHQLVINYVVLMPRVNILHMRAARNSSAIIEEVWCRTTQNVGPTMCTQISREYKVRY
jgi:hypothetical protein